MATWRFFFTSISFDHQSSEFRPLTYVPVTLCYILSNYQLYFSDPFSTPSHRPSTTQYDFLTRRCPTNHRYYTSVPQGMHCMYSSLDQPTKASTHLSLENPPGCTHNLNSSPSPYALQSISHATSIQSRTRKQQPSMYLAYANQRLPPSHGLSLCSGSPASEKPSSSRTCTQIS